MNDGASAGLHEEGRFFDHVMADIDDKVRAVDGAMNIIVRRQRRGSKIQRVCFVEHAFAHLRIEERKLCLADELAQRLASAAPVGAGTDQQQRAFCGQNALSRFIERCISGHGILARMGRNDRFGRFFIRNIFRQFQQNRARPLFLRSPEAFANQRRDPFAIDDLLGHLAQGGE